MMVGPPMAVGWHWLNMDVQICRPCQVSCRPPFWGDVSVMVPGFLTSVPA